MKHFTYEIDERILREQLNNIAIPLKDENWLRFEQYAAAQAPVLIPKNRLANLQVHISRNVVLPVVFGVVIIMFSFLLFNFISIKNPTGTSQAISNKDVQVKLPEIPKNLSPINPVINATAQPVKSSDGTKAAVTEVKKEEKPHRNSSSTGQITLEVADNSQAVRPNQTSEKKEIAPVVDEAILANIRPDIISEDTDPEIRPN
jgi:hypothetical protein